jgi:galactokinase
MKWILMVTVLFVLILSSCYNDSIESLTKVDICDVTEVTFSQDVTKILNNSCALSGCHNAECFTDISTYQLR